MVSPKMIYVPGNLSPLEGAVGIQPQGDDLPRTAAPPSIGECTIPSHGWFMTLLYPTLFEKPAIFRMLWRHVLGRSKRQTLASSCSWPLASLGHQKKSENAVSCYTLGVSSRTTFDAENQQFRSDQKWQPC